MGLKESTPSRKPTQGTLVKVATPRAERPGMMGEDDLSPLPVGQVNSTPGNPFVEGQEVLTPNRLRAELLSFVTRLRSGLDRAGTEEVFPSAGAWPLRKEQKIFKGSDMKERLEGKRHRPNIVPDRYSWKVLWIEYHRNFESSKRANGWDDEEAGHLPCRLPSRKRSQSAWGKVRRWTRVQLRRWCNC